MGRKSKPHLHKFDWWRTRLDGETRSSKTEAGLWAEIANDGGRRYDGSPAIYALNRSGE